MADAAAPTRLWSRDYVFDIGVNFLVYSVHFLLMLWSTAYAIYTWNASISMAGLASGLFIVGALFARIPAGRFIDFVGRRKMFLAGTLMFFLLVLCYELAPTLEVFMVVRFLHGLSFGTTSTAASTVVAALVPARRATAIAPLAALRPPLELIAGFTGGSALLPQGTGMTCGTVPAMGGIRPATHMCMELHDPRLSRSIRHQYQCELLPVVA